MAKKLGFIFLIFATLAATSNIALAAAIGDANICEYVADAFNAKKMREISVGSGEYVRSDGTKSSYSVKYAGTAAAPFFVSTSGDGLDIDFFEPETMWTGDDIYIVPNLGAFYVVYVNEGALESVAQPGVGSTCQYEAITKPKLITNRSPKICEKLVDQEFFEELPALLIGDEHISSNGIGFSAGQTYFEYKLSLELNGKPVTLAGFHMETGAGGGCTQSGLAIIDQGKIEESARSKALLAAQSEILDCRSTTATAVTIDGEILLSLTGKSGGRAGVPSRRLIKLEGDHTEEVCRVDDLKTYVPH